MGQELTLRTMDFLETLSEMLIDSLIYSSWLSDTQPHDKKIALEL